MTSPAHDVSVARASSRVPWQLLTDVCLSYIVSFFHVCWSLSHRPASPPRYIRCLRRLLLPHLIAVGSSLLRHRHSPPSFPGGVSARYPDQRLCAPCIRSTSSFLFYSGALPDPAGALCSVSTVPPLSALSRQSFPSSESDRFPSVSLPGL